MRDIVISELCDGMLLLLLLLLESGEGTYAVVFEFGSFAVGNIE